MKRNQVAAVSVCLIGIITVGVIYILQPAPLNISDLSWGVEVNDTYTFDIGTWGESYGGTYTSSQVHPLNGTSITVIVTYLPAFDAVHDAESFSSEIIFRNKVTCTFVNGTALDEWANTTLCRVISGSILPIGDWSSLDQLFPGDTPSSWNPGEDAIATVLFNTRFLIEYKWWGSIDGFGGWRGNVTLSTGAPSSIVWYYSHGLTGPLTIELNRIV